METQSRKTQGQRIKTILVAVIVFLSVISISIGATDSNTPRWQTAPAQYTIQPDSAIIILRSDVCDTDSPAITTYSYDAWPTAKAWKRDMWVSGLIVEGYIRKTDPNGAAVGSVPYNLWGKWGGDFGHIELLASGVFTAGTEAVTKDPNSGLTSTADWIGTISNTALSCWVSDVFIRNSGNNNIAKLLIPLNGLQSIYVEFTAMPANTTITIVGMGNPW